MDIKELIDAIGNIEDNLQSTGPDYFHISLRTNAIVFKVFFLNIPLWSNEDDERDVDEVTEEHEPIEPFLRRAINIELAKLGQVRV